MTCKVNLIGFIAAVVWPAAIAPAQAQDCNGNGVPDDVDLAGRMYWTDNDTDKIQRANLDGSNVEDLITTGLQIPAGISVDPAAGKMYWADILTKKIQRADQDGSNVEDLITIGVVGPVGIALDLAAGKMYWTDSLGNKIRRADLDGAFAQDLITVGVFGPTGLALDPTAGKMYWTDSDKIRRADLDGGNIENLVTGLSNPRHMALALPSPDTDADGLMDVCDGCPNDPTKSVPGSLGCGVFDADGDAVPDNFDPCPNDPNKLDPGICGCGVSDIDSDDDGVPDCNQPNLVAGSACCGAVGLLALPLALLTLCAMRLARRAGRGGRRATFPNSLSRKRK